MPGKHLGQAKPTPGESLLGTASGGYTPNDANAATPVPVSWEVQPEPFWL